MNHTRTSKVLNLGLLKVADLEALLRPVYRVYLASPLTDVPKKWRRLTARAREAIKDSLVSSRYADFSVYDPFDYTAPGSSHTSDEILEINSFQIAIADLFVLCRTSPADGVGVEYNLALSYKVPTVIVHPAKQRISRVLLAQPSVHLPNIPFDGIPDLRQRLGAQLQNIAQVTVAERIRRRHLNASNWHSQFRRMIVKLRIRRKISREQLARECRMSPGKLKQVEQYDEVVVGLSNLDSQAILQALEFRVNLRPGHGISLPTDDELDLCPESIHPELRSTWIQSLDSLVDFVMTEMPPDDGRVLQIWAAHDELMVESVAGRESFLAPLTVEQWRAQYLSKPSRGLL